MSTDNSPEPGQRDPVEGAITDSVSRRKFVQGVVLSAMAAGMDASAGAAFIPYRESQPLLTARSSRILPPVLNRLIPATDAMPGAGNLGITHFVDRLLASAPHLAPHIETLLSALPDEEAFSRLSDEEADALLRRVETENSEGFDLLTQAAYAGYYGHPTVQQILAWVDPVDSGYHYEPLEAGSLADVRLRGMRLAADMLAQIPKKDTI